MDEFTVIIVLHSKTTRQWGVRERQHSIVVDDYDNEWEVTEKVIEWCSENGFSYDEDVADWYLEPD